MNPNAHGQCARPSACLSYTRWSLDLACGGIELLALPFGGWGEGNHTESSLRVNSEVAWLR